MPILINKWWHYLDRNISLRSVVCLLLSYAMLISCSINTEHRMNSRTIKTKYGSLRGLLVNFPNKNLQPVEIFLGIPYASPPIGKLRFMPPVTPAIWSGVHNANAFGPVCPQKLADLRNETRALQKMTKGRLKILRRMQSMLKNQSEDCLYLNIYSPSTASAEETRLPVMVFVHGESYEWNAGSTYDGSVLASFANVVVVTINFRLGILGFFPSPGGSARGNFGLMDQVAALHWIQENIREFGGDERNVTIIGYDYGAACVNFLMLSPMARGLFHRVVMQSGSALSPWAIASDSIIHAKNVAKVLGCGEHSSTNSVLDCLRQKNVQDIIAIEIDVPTHLTAFGPVIDGIVIPNDPQTLMSKPNSIFSNYDLIFGVTKIESYNLFSMFDERHGIDISRRDRLLRTLVRNLFNYHLQEIFLTILNEYTDWTRPFFHPISLFDSLIDIFSDALVVAPIVQVGLLHSKLSRNTYFYTFTHQTENSDYNPRLGCIHGQDLAYLFGAPLVNGFQISWFAQNYTRTEMTLSENYIRFITNFVKTGNPNLNYNKSNSNLQPNSNKYLASIDTTNWPPYDEIQQKYISFGLKMSVQDHYLAHKLSYWFNLLPQLHKPGASASEEHHLLDSHDNIHSYEGVVRYGSLSAPISFNTYFSSDTSQVVHNGSSSTLYHPSNMTSKMGMINLHSNQAANKSASDKKTVYQQSALDMTFNKNNANEGNASFSMIVQSGNYSTALSLTIAIGCSLLILNVLVFAGIFYQKDRNRLETKLMRKKKQSKQNPKLSAQVPQSNYNVSNKDLQMYRINSITDNYNQRNMAN